jgi:hypothetical protein
MKKMFIGKFDLDLFGDELTDTKAKALVRQLDHYLYIDRRGDKQTVDK